MKHVRPRVRSIPALGKVRHNIHPLVVRHQTVEEQPIQMLRLRVRPDARIQTNRHRLNQKGDRPRRLSAPSAPAAAQHEARRSTKKRARRGASWRQPSALASHYHPRANVFRVIPPALTEEGSGVSRAFGFAGSAGTRSEESLFDVTTNCDPHW
jgi:hypothetical protein